MISAPGPAEKLPETPYGAIPDHIEPGWKNGSTGPYRDQDTAVKVETARVEALEAVDGGKAGLGVAEGEKLPACLCRARHGRQVHRATVARCGAFRGWLEDGCQVLGKARLCLPVRVRTQTGGHVGERVGGAVGQDVRLGHLQDGDAGWPPYPSLAEALRVRRFWRHPQRPPLCGQSVVW